MCPLCISSAVAAAAGATSSAGVVAVLCARWRRMSSRLSRWRRGVARQR
ncbi:MAG: hypothetical protein JSR67_02300 [Proteobacteria bacterium]|nr:hypothetical protein [Pseudomonadota bacterium]